MIPSYETDMPVSRCSPPPLGVIFLVAVCAALTGCAPALDWREVRPDGLDGLQALFPCKPEHHTRPVQLSATDAAREPLAMQVWSCSADGALWAVSHVQTRSPEERLQALPALSDALWANAATAPGPRTASGTTAQRHPLGPVNVPGMTPHPSAQAWWGTDAWRPGVQGGVNVVVWHFSRGLSVYQASVWKTSLRADDPAVNTFMQGFNFAR